MGTRVETQVGLELLPSSRCGRNLPSLRRLNSKQAEGMAGDQMAL
jgi:hypothetical protein